MHRWLAERTRRIRQRIAERWRGAFRRDARPADAGPGTVLLMEETRAIRKGTAAEDDALDLDREVDDRVRTGVETCWQLGRHDGGLRADFVRGRTVAIRRAADVYVYLKAFYESEASTRTLKSEAQKTASDESQADHEYARAHRMTLEREYQQHPRKFSWPLGVFYVLSALVLVLADIPLAVSLTADAFDYDMIEGADFALLTSDPLRFFGENWQALLVSTGIAFFAVFIKMYWDEFVGRPLELSVTKFKERPGIEGDEEVELIRRVDRRRFWAKTMVLVLTFFTLVCLGLLRNEIEQERRANEAAFAEAVREPAGGPGVEAAPLIDVPESPFFLIVFICITIMFPLIGGVAASLGLGYIEARLALRTSRRHERRTRKARDAAIEEKRQAAYAAKRAAIRNDSIGDTYADDLRELFVASYEHGYQTGFLTPTVDGDTFALAQRLHQWAQARRFVQTLSDSDGDAPTSGKGPGSDSPTSSRLASADAS